jgi:hypothetical protein
MHCQYRCDSTDAREQYQSEQQKLPSSLAREQCTHSHAVFSARDVLALLNFWLGGLQVGGHDKGFTVQSLSQSTGHYLYFRPKMASHPYLNSSAALQAPSESTVSLPGTDYQPRVCHSHLSAARSRICDSKKAQVFFNETTKDHHNAPVHRPLKTVPLAQRVLPQHPSPYPPLHLPHPPHPRLRIHMDAVHNGSLFPTTVADSQGGLDRCSTSRR